MIKTRSATLDDLPILRTFEQGIIRSERPFDPTLDDDPISYYDLEALIRSDESEVMVATSEKEVVASGFVRIAKAKPYLNHEYYGYLGFMYVKEEFRGRGINKLIVEALIDWCREKGIDEIRLEVYADNAPAVNAYKKAGFSNNLVEMRMNLKD